MSDFQITEKLYLFKDVPKLVKKVTGQKVSIPCIYRWANKGAMGGTIKLKTIQLPDARYVTESLVREFFAECAASDWRQKQNGGLRKGAKRDMTKKRLRKAGLKTGKKRSTISNVSKIVGGSK